jgi:transketolase
MTPPSPELSVRCVNALKFLAVDAVEQARSGHPGICMGAADVAFVLWSRFLRFDPAAPDWPGRDRFILSAGHGSALNYSLLHLFGYDLSIDELMRFRQVGSRTPGHPEYGHTPGIEVTTGPLGQGIAHGVGMALAARMTAARFDRPGHALFDHRVFVLCGDGCLMEGVVHEAAALAGHLGLGNLVVLYDSNRITIEGSTDVAWSEDVPARFRSLGWHVAEADGHAHASIAAGISEAVADTARPSLVVCHTEIAHGAPTLHGQAKTHGSPLGPDEVAKAKTLAGWPTQPFFVPPDAREFFASIARAGREAHEDWDRRRADWADAHPGLAAVLDTCRDPSRVPADLDERFLAAALTASGKATRVVSNRVLQAAYRAVPNLAGGSADLGPSNETRIQDGGDVASIAGPDKRTVDWSGANLHFGIREHAMAAVVNGLALDGTFRPYGATFLVFSDYLKPSIRLAALMKVPSLFVFTHDSIGVGEDGPTHQPIEQLWMLRSIPGLTVFRPADPVEVAAAWSYAIRDRRGPVVLALSRQNLPVLDRPAGCGFRDALAGGYVLRPSDGPAEATLVATGSEVSLAVAAAAILETRGRRVRVVSLPSLDRFLDQPQAYRDAVLPPGIPVVTIEAGSTVGWHGFGGGRCLAIGLDRFGAAGPAERIFELFGFTPEAVAGKIEAWV